MKRRAFLRTAALSTLAAVSLSPLSLGQSRLLQRRRLATAKKVPLSVQLYCVRHLASKDLAGTLVQIAKMGYAAVEFAGYYGKDAKDIRKMLDDAGLKCSGTHTGIGDLRGDNFGKTAELHKTLGTKYMIVGGLDAEMRSVDGIKQVAEEFNELAKKAKPLDLFVGYHAHDGDARKIEGMPAWERFFDATIKDVVMQMDIGNYMIGGGDPYKMIEKFKGRSKTIHLKEFGEGNPIIGSGEVDWRRVFSLCETVGGVEWYVVEDEEAPDSFERIEKSIIAMRKMGK